MTNKANAPTAPARKAAALEAKASPTTVFDNPQKVVSADHLTEKEKSGILVQWEADAISLQTATDEGMTGGGRPRLDEVKSAQTLLGAKAATISSAATTMTLINTFKVAPEKADSLIAALVEAIGETMRPQKGFISASIHKSMDGGRIVNYVQWANKTDYDKMNIDPLAQDHMARCAAIAKSVKPIIYDVVFSE